VLYCASVTKAVMGRRLHSPLWHDVPMVRLI